MKKHSGLIAVLMTILLCISMLGSVLIIAEHTPHDCTGEGCAVCMVLEQCNERARALGTAAASLLMLLSIIFAVMPLPVSAICTVSSHTPITMKVKLLN